jgi:hypothetical protein
MEFSFLRVKSMALRLYPRENLPIVPTHWIGGWVDPRNGLDAVMSRRKSLSGAKCLLSSLYID